MTNVQRNGTALAQAPMSPAPNKHEVRRQFREATAACGQDDNPASFLEDLREVIPYGGNVMLKAVVLKGELTHMVGMLSWEAVATEVDAYVVGQLEALGLKARTKRTTSHPTRSSTLEERQLV